MSSCDSYADVAELRSALYDLFGAAFRYPAPEVLADLKSRERGTVLLEMMEEAYSVMPEVSETIALFTESVEALGGSGEVGVEYARLFIGPYHLPSPPYESVYRGDSGRLLMAESTLDVRRSYREEGLDLSEAVCDLPDHIIPEMEFMSYLCGAEAALRIEGGGEAETYLRKQDAFLGDHLAAWIPQFSRAICSSTRTEFYRLLARLTDQFIALDHDFVRMLIGRPAERRRLG
jgi:putative dimethyl sulfoxide reductase chaperone